MNEKILLFELLNFTPIERNQAKIKFNTKDSRRNGDDPLEKFLEDPDIVNTGWLLKKTKAQRFNINDIAICLVKFSEKSWLLTGIKKITKSQKDQTNLNFEYEGKEIQKYKCYFGRVIIKLENKPRNNILKRQRYVNSLIVSHILTEVYLGRDFPGYDNVKLSWKELKSIIDHSINE
jgi:hypothetical protein